MKRPPRDTAPRPAAPAGRTLLLFTIFFTNLLSLSCQVLWLRKLSYVFGSTATVFSTVLSIFLLGLAFGALFGGRMADRSPAPWRRLATLQIVLGLYCFASLPIFDVGRSAFLAVFPNDMAPLPTALAKFVVILLCMILPTLAIGAAFPLAVRLYSREMGTLGHDISLIYGLDTLGAALGALLAGFVLVPQLGLRASTLLLGVTALLLGALIFLLRGESEGRTTKRDRKERKKAEAPPPQAEPAPAVAASGGRLQVILWTFFLSGGAALLLETGWNRFFSLLNGTHVYSTSTVLAGFLLGIGLGSLIMSRFIDRIRDPFATVAALYGVIALCGMLVFRSDGLFARAYFKIFDWSDSYYGFQLSVCLVIFLIVILATLAMGANFPLVARIATRAAEERGSSAGKVFFANTLGAVAGAFLAEFVLLPAWGFSGLMMVTLAIYALAAAVFLALSPASGRMAKAAVCATLLAGAVLLSPAVLDLRLPIHALYYHGLRVGSWEGYRQEVSRMKVLDEKQSFYGQVAVVEIGEDLLLKHNGKTDASTNVRDNRTQILLGHLPMLFHPNPKRVLAIGLGGGFTLRALVHHQTPTEIAMVEIDPQVVEAAREHFGKASDNALDDPRVRLVTNDGRNYVDSAEGRYDVITSEPPNIWVAGVSGLFTQEFYQAADRRLAPGGILCQWVPLYEMEREDFRIMLHTITTVFDHVTFWQIGTDIAIIASNTPFKVELHQILQKIQDLDIRRDFAEAGYSMQGAVDLLNSPAVFPDQVPAFLGRVETINTDDKPVLEFSTARNLFELAKGK
ncbi:MAG TPA: fused MFS/spermidine synthase [Thermoanaerobaculia bacterium]|nr:fused MFS/spermidine synthase [Thermoanaerobaculia bacterium]